MIKSLSTFIFLLACLALFSQNSTIKGTVRDKVSEVPLMGAVVTVVKSVALINGNQSDLDGNFNLTDIIPGRYQLVVEYIGYKSLTIPNILVTSGKEVILDIGLEEDIMLLNEVVVKGTVDKDKTINELATISARTFSLEEVSRYSGGRNDASRLVSNFAGVATANDNRNDIVVRGNSPSGILWRLEGISIPNPNHFSTLGTTGGPVSALNTNLLKNSDFLTSAFPSEYGNALSGVFDVGFRSGNKDKHEFTAQLAAFSGLEAMAEGPIGKKGDKSYLISYRYSFVQLANSVGLNFGTNATPKYQDLSYMIDLGKSRLGSIKLFGIIARSDIEFKGKEITDADFFSTKDQDSRATSNINVFGVKHSILFNQNNYLKTTIAYSTSGNKYYEYRYKDTTYTNRNLYTNVDDQTPRVSINSFFNTKYNASLSSRIGFNYDNRSMNSIVDNREFNVDLDNDGINDLIRVRDIAQSLSTIEPYATFKLKANEKLSVIGGLHGMLQTFNSKIAIEPRASLSYTLSPKTTINLGYGLHSQTQPLPVLFLKSFDTDGQLKPLNEDLDLARAHHIVLGTDIIPADQWRIKVETYYQHLFNIAVEKFPSSFSLLNAGADFVFPQVGDLNNDGKGRNYGIELTVEKFFSNQFYGLLTASIFQSKYTGSDGIERNTAFNNQYVFNALGGKEWKLGSKNVLTTDFKFTFAGGRYTTPVDLEKSKLMNQEVYFEEKAFSEQLKNYMRLDFKIGIRMNNKGFSQQFALDFQNITNNQNIFSKRYNRVTNKIDTLYQIGFFPDILWRVQF
jgi:hypothetical protein